MITLLTSAYRREIGIRAEDDLNRYFSISVCGSFQHSSRQSRYSGGGISPISCALSFSSDPMIHNKFLTTVCVPSTRTNQSKYLDPIVFQLLLLLLVCSSSDERGTLLLLLHTAARHLV